MPAALDASAAHRGAKAIGIGVVAQQCPASVDDRVDRADPTCGRREVVAMWQHDLLVGHRDVGAQYIGIPQ